MLAAKQSALRLVSLLTAHFPGFRDQAIYKGRQVSLSLDLTLPLISLISACTLVKL